MNLVNKNSVLILTFVTTCKLVSRRNVSFYPFKLQIYFGKPCLFIQFWAPSYDATVLSSARG